MTILKLIKSDLYAINAKLEILHIFAYGLFSHNKRALILLRISNGTGISAFLSKHLLKPMYFIEIGCKEICPYLRLPHPHGIILSAKKNGFNCLISQWVTLGGNNCEFREEKGCCIHVPTIGDNVQVYSGSIVAGPISIGNDVVIGANSTVTFDVEAHTLIYNRPSVSKHKVTVPGYKGAFIKEELLLN